MIIAWLQAGFEASPASIGLLGAVVVDMQGAFLPAERVDKRPFVAYECPQDVAYISNLAVIPQAWRQGIGEQLLLAAESVRCLAPALRFVCPDRCCWLLSLHLVAALVFKPRRPLHRMIILLCRLP